MNLIVTNRNNEENYTLNYVLLFRPNLVTLNMYCKMILNHILAHFWKVYAKSIHVILMLHSNQTHIDSFLIITWNNWVHVDVYYVNFFDQYIFLVGYVIICYYKSRILIIINEFECWKKYLRIYRELWYSNFIFLVKLNVISISI